MRDYWKGFLRMITPSKRLPPADAEKPVNERYIEALNLNKKIIVSAQLAQQNLYEMCMGFKKMRDDKLYKELGYSDFGEYCENETGFKRSQVYSYIAVVEKLPADFVQSTGQIGVQKMYLLSRLSEEARTEITAETDLESTTVKELERQIKKLKESNERLNRAFDRIDGINEVNYQKYLETEHKRQELEQKCKELESRPIEVATQIVEKIPDEYITREAYEKMAASYVEQLDKADEELVAEKRRAYAEREELEKKIAELENAPSVGNEMKTFKLLRQICREPLTRLTLFVNDHKNYKNDFINFISEFTEIRKEN